MSIAPLERTSNRTSFQAGSPAVLPRRERGIRPAPDAVPNVGLRVRIVRRQTPSILGALAIRGALFGSLFLATFISHSVMGQVAVEKARQEELTARGRAVEAKRAETEIRARVDALTSATAVQQWATARSYVAPGTQNADPKTAKPKV